MIECWAAATPSHCQILRRTEAFGSSVDQARSSTGTSTLCSGGGTPPLRRRSLALIEDGVDRLTTNCGRNAVTSKLNPSGGWGRGARFYPLLYMLTRVKGARDWENGSSSRLGAMGQLHLHHIFPKSKLYEAGYSRPEVNSLANLTFLTAATNQEVSNRDPGVPADYAAKHSGAVESHWIPNDAALWSLDRYHDFLNARRELLAAAANQMLGQLLTGYG